MAVVFGRFDSIHDGHRRLLYFARTRAEKLIIGLFSDDYPGVNAQTPQHLRMQNCASVDVVDEVIVVSKPISLAILDIRPDLVVKGAEFKNQYNPEQEAIESVGGQLVFAPGQYLLPSTRSELRIQDFYIDDRIQSHVVSYCTKYCISREALFDLIDNFRSLNIGVFGDVIVDEYMSTRIEGISSEDGTTSLKPLGTNSYLGGAAASLQHANELSNKAFFWSSIGGDEKGQLVKDRLNDLSIQSFLEVDDERVTPTKTRIQYDEKSLLRINDFTEGNVDPSVIDKLLSSISEHICQLDLMFLCDFSFGIFSANVAERILEICQSNDVFVAADSQTSSRAGDIRIFKSANFMAPTELEARKAVEQSDLGLVALSNEIRDVLDLQHLMLTLGEAGILMHQCDGNRVWTDEIPALNTKSVDVSGAGDSFLSVAAMSLVCGGSEQEAALLGSFAAAIQVSRQGNRAVTQTDLRALIDLFLDRH